MIKKSLVCAVSIPHLLRYSSGRASRSSVLRNCLGTGYRDAKRVMPRITSRNDSIRLGLFFLALVISNIWTIVRSGDDDDSGSSIKLVVLIAYMISSYVNDARPCKPPDPGEG